MLRKISLGVCICLLLAGTVAANEPVKSGDKTASGTVVTIKSTDPIVTIRSTDPVVVIKADNADKEKPTVSAVKKEIQRKTEEKTVAEPINEKESISHEKKIAINLASRFLTLYEGNTKIRMYAVGVGKISTPTPTGYYQVIDKTVDPVWTDPDDTKVQVQSGDDNPLGYRWLGFYGNYGIHGTNKPYSVGGYVSNGCIRLHEEDVEDLYSLVSVGTPIEIFYDRIVIDRDADHTISYYIYPDGYGWQPLTVGMVRKALSGYGVENFEPTEAIQNKIAASDGEPTYVAKAYSLYVNRKKLPDKALKKSDVLYIPAVAVADAINLDLKWDTATGLLTSPYGAVKGYVRNDVVYANIDDSPVLYHLQGLLNKYSVVELNDMNNA